MSPVIGNVTLIMSRFLQSAVALSDHWDFVIDLMVVQYCQTYTDREHGKILTYGSYGPYELKMASRIVRTVRFVKRIYRS